MLRGNWAKMRYHGGSLTALETMELDLELARGEVGEDSAVLDIIRSVYGDLSRSFEMGRQLEAFICDEGLWDKFFNIMMGKGEPGERLKKEFEYENRERD